MVDNSYIFIHHHYPKQFYFPMHNTLEGKDYDVAAENRITASGIIKSKLILFFRTANGYKPFFRKNLPVLFLYV